MSDSYLRKPLTVWTFKSVVVYLAPLLLCGHLLSFDLTPFSLLLTKAAQLYEAWSVSLIHTHRHTHTHAHQTGALKPAGLSFHCMFHEWVVCWTCEEIKDDDCKIAHLFPRLWSYLESDIYMSHLIIQVPVYMNITLPRLLICLLSS